MLKKTFYLSFLFLALPLIMFLAVGCSSQDDHDTLIEEPVVYENTDFRFMLTLPPVWDYNYQVRDLPGESFWGSTISFLFAPDNTLIEPETPVFSVHVMNQKSWLELSPALQAQLGEPFASNGNTVYVVRYPQELPFTSESPELTLFQQMLLDPDALKAAFTSLPKETTVFEQNDFGIRLELPPLWQDNYISYVSSFEGDANITCLHLAFAPAGETEEEPHDVIQIYKMKRAHYDNLEHKQQLPDAIFLLEYENQVYMGTTFFSPDLAPSSSQSDAALWRSLALSRQDLAADAGSTAFLP